MAEQLQDQIQITSKEVYLTLTLINYYEQRENVFVIYTPALDLYAYGEDEQSALQAFEETIMLYLDYVITEQTLADHLTNLGWQRQPHVKTQFIPSPYSPAAIMADKGIKSFHTLGKKLALQT